MSHVFATARSLILLDFGRGGGWDSITVSLTTVYRLFQEISGRRSQSQRVQSPCHTKPQAALAHAELFNFPECLEISRKL